MRPFPLLFLGLVATLVGCSPAVAPPEPVRAVRVTTIAADSAGLTHEYAGEVRARSESRLGFRVGGKLVRRQVDLGDTVRAGQTLAQLDPQDLRLGQASAQAALVSAQVNLAQAETDWKRYRELRDQGFISSAELDRRDTALRAARAQLDQARAQADVQGNQAKYTTLVADTAGVVTAVEAEPGAVVQAGTTVLRLAHEGPRDVQFSVPEDRAGALRAMVDRPGSLTVRLWGADTRSIPARIREIAAAADPVTRTFLVKADIGRAPVQLGQTATVLLEQPRQPNIVKLPLTALFEQQGGSAVWVLDRESMTVKPQAVVVAGADGNEVVVADGLKPGQTIVTAGVHVLTPGQKVKLYAERSAATRPERATTVAR